MSEKNLEIASVKEIGQVLRAARERKGYTADYVGTAINSTGATVGRWEKGDVEGGCNQVARAAALLDLTPNQLLLHSGVQPDDTLSEDDRVALRSILVDLAVIRRVCKGADINPIRALADFLSAKAHQYTGEKFPVGTVIQTKGKGETTYDPPPAADPKASSGAAEAKPKYGKGRKRKE